MLPYLETMMDPYILFSDAVLTASVKHLDGSRIVSRPMMSWRDMPWGCKVLGEGPRSDSSLDGSEW